MIEPDSGRHRDLPRAADRRLSNRFPSEVEVSVGDGFLVSTARSVDISAGGMLIARAHDTRSTDERLYLEVHMNVPGTHELVTALARPVWSYGPYQALKFIRMSDVDRLTLAEHMDRIAREGARARRRGIVAAVQSLHAATRRRVRRPPDVQ